MKRVLSLTIAIMLLAISVLSACTNTSPKPENSGQPQPTDDLSLTPIEDSITPSIKDPSEEPIEVPTDPTLQPMNLDDETAQAITNFAIHWFQQESTRQTLERGSNVMISPLSLYEALAMTMNGASGETLTEALRVLEAEDQDSLNAAANYQPGSSLKTANSIWIKESYGELDETFQTKIENFHAEAYSRPFNPTTVDEINAWVYAHTDGMIPKLLEELDPDDAMHLINAVCFESEWLNPYTEDMIARDDLFTNSQGTEETVNMMVSYGDGYYFAYNGADCLVKEYEDPSLVFIAMLPEKGESLTDFIARMDGASFAEAYQTAYTPDTLITRIPEFMSDYTVSPVDDLRAMGMNRAFDVAEIDGILANHTDLMISAITQKTHIEVDRHGTKAAAVTDVAMTEGAAEDYEPDIKQVILNRPFVYAIADARTGMPIFLGAMNSVNEIIVD